MWEYGLVEARRAVIAKVVAAAALASVLASQCGCFWHAAEQAHQEMLSLRSSIKAGMTPGEIEATFKTLRPQHLRYAGAAGSVVIVVQSAPSSGLDEWVLWISLRGGHAAALRIRTADSDEERPPGAPEDIIWQAEDLETPFHAQAPR